MTPERLARIALARLVEPGHWGLHAAVADRGAVEVLAMLLSGGSLPGLTEQLREGIRTRVGQRDVHCDAEHDHAAAVAFGARLLLPGDPDWPAGLTGGRHADARLPAPPLLLFVHGSAGLADLSEQAVAVVGARAASRYGEHVARSLGIELADQEVTVVSGAAFGIDGAAHRGALLARGGRTVAVLACGVDVAYPAGHDRLIADITRSGAVVSEQVLGARPSRAGFLIRNRLIAALSQGTVVVEAALRSGSLSTVHRAAELGRQTMAVPGPVTSPASAGCHELVRAGVAQLVTGVADVLELVRPVGESLPEARRGPERVRDGLSDAVRQVLDALPIRGGMGVAELAQASGVPVQVVLRSLPPLQVSGLVTTTADGWVLTPLGAGR